MRKLLSVCLVATCLVFIANSARAQAIAARTWVSGVGDDDNSCSRTAPCKTFAGALAKTESHGEIDCLDPGGFGNVLIRQSVTIDCHDVLAGSTTSNPGADAIWIQFQFFDSSDTTKQVIHRNMAARGDTTQDAGIRISGTGQGTFVSIEDCVVSANFGSPNGAGIVDERGRGALAIDNAKVINNGLAGIQLPGASDGSFRAVITNTRVYNSTVGINIGADVYVQLTHSIVSNNETAGLIVATGGALMVDSTTISHNGNGIQNTGLMQLSNSDVTYNTTAISGSISSFSNNRFGRNTSMGGTIVPITQQ